MIRSAQTGRNLDGRSLASVGPITGNSALLLLLQPRGNIARLFAVRRKGRKLLALGHAQPLANGFDFSGLEQPGVVGGITGQGQIPAFDRIGKNHNRLGLDSERLGKGFEHPFQVVPAQIGQQFLDLIRLITGQQFSHGRVFFSVGLNETITDSDTVLEQQALVLLIAHLIDPGSEFESVGFAEDVFELVAVFEVNDMPAVGGEHFPQLLSAAVRDHAVEALAVQVHNPQHARHALGIGFTQRFPDIALVQLGITHQGNMPARSRPILRRNGFPVRAVGMVLQIVTDQGTKERRHRAQTDRAG